MQSKTLYLGIGALITFCSLATTQALVIDPLTGNVSGYTPTLVLDNSHGVNGLSLSSSGSGLSENYVATGTSAEQALFFAPASSFSGVFAVGDTLSVSTAIPVSGTVEDFGLAIGSASTVTASSANGYDARSSFDWASISIRPSQNAIRVNDSISGVFASGTGVVGIGSPANITGLYITWVSADVFNVGYMTASGTVSDENITFANGSTIGTDIGFYGDLRATGTSLGTFSNLTVVPEPSTLALSAMGFAGLFAMIRRKK